MRIKWLINRLTIKRRLGGIMSQYKASLKVEKYRGGAIEIFKIGIWGPRLSDWRDVVEDYIDISRKRFKNKLAMFHLQLDLLRDVSDEEKIIKMNKDIIKNPENIKKYTDEQEVIDNLDIEDVKIQLADSKLRLHALLEVGDGHMWRMFNYNRPLLYVVGTHMDAGPMRYDTGFLSELYGWASSILDKKVSHFLFNSITNFGRIGDVIVRYQNGEVEIKEIKSSESQRGIKRKERLDRQTQTRDNFLSFANSGEGYIGKEKIGIFKSDIKINNSLLTLDSGLREAEEKGISYRKINPYLNVVCMDMQTYSEREDDADIATSYLDKASQDWTIQSNNILPYNSFDRLVYSPNFTPISLYPFSAKHVADILFKKKVVWHFLNIDILFQEFSKYKWDVISFIGTKENYDKKNEPFCVLKRGDMNVALPWTISNMILFDLVKVKSIIGILDYFYKNKIADKQRYLIGFEGEEKVWY